MSKSDNSVLDLLVPKQRFGREDWLKLIESRLNRIKPHLDNFTLKSLGQHLYVPYAQGLTLSDVFARGVPFDGHKAGMINEQGLHFTSPRSDFVQWKKEENRIERVLWSFLRRGTYILITLHYNLEDLCPGCQKVGDLSRVIIEETNLKVILSHYPDSHLQSESIGPAYLWWDIGRRVEEFTSSRRSLYESAKRLQDSFLLEEMLLERSGAGRPESTPPNTP